MILFALQRYWILRIDFVTNYTNWL